MKFKILSIILILLALSQSLTQQALADMPDSQTWTINVKNADINDFVGQVANITGKTFVIDPRLKGRVTVASQASMDKEAIYALFQSVLRVHNFVATESGGVVRIQQNVTGKQAPGASGTIDQVPPETLITQVVEAQNVTSTELVKILRPLIPQYGHIAAVPEPNIVIISDHADNIRRLVRIIRQIDIADEDEVVVVPMEHAWVGTIVRLLERVAPQQIGNNAQGPQKIQLIANERNNSIVLRGKSRPIGEVLKLIEKLDRPATTAGSTQVIYLKHADALKTSEVLNGLIQKRSNESGENTTIQPDESLNAIIVRANPGDMNQILDIIKNLDVRRAQVLIEAAIVEVTIATGRDIGVETAIVDEDGSTSPLASTALNGTVQNLLGSIISEDGSVDVVQGLANVTGPTLAAAKIDRGGISFGAVINALASNSNANLLSTPSILTLDNQEAKIVVGNEVPFRTGSFSTTGDGSNNPFTTIQREDVGLQLTVTPHVHDGSSVRLEIAQEITNVVDTAIGNSGFSDVVTSKRTIETMILAEDEQTIVLGGLIQDDITDTVRKVPLLGDIPGLGWFFRTTSNTRTKSNLLVFLRPTVIRSNDDATKATERKYDDIWEIEINSDISETFKGRKRQTAK